LQSKPKNSFQKTGKTALKNLCYDYKIQGGSPMQSIKNAELLSQFKTLVASERKITAQVLKYIAEIDRRRLYLELAFGSLFDFLTKGNGYSNGAAMRRIQAARLLRDVPEVLEKIQTGEVNLSQLTILQKATKEHLAQTGHKIDSKRKQELVQKIIGKTQQQTVVVLNCDLQIALPKVIPQPVYHKDESVTLTLRLSKEQLAVAEQTRSLLSHAVPGGEWEKILDHLFRKEIKKRTASAGRFVPAIKKQLLNKEACCQFVDSLTGRKCGSVLRLELEHIMPRWAGGNDQVHNLTILCPQHNKFRYREQAQIQVG
jgi:hypothetical protein